MSKLQALYRTNQQNTSKISFHPENKIEDELYVITNKTII